MVRQIFIALSFVLFCSCSASAQAVWTGKATSWDAAVGYSYVSQPQVPSGRAGLNGVSGSVTLGLSSHLGITGDLGYARSSNLLGSNHSYLLTYMGGPVFYPTRQGRVQADVHFLLGGAKVAEPIPTQGGILLGGYSTGFAWAAGGGVNYRIKNFLAIRSGADYVRTRYFGSSLTLQGQNNIRATVSVVYLFGSQRRRRRGLGQQ